MLAKSNGQSLEAHSVLVSKFAEKIAKQTILDCDEKLLHVIKIAALLHDIGKCTIFFQNKLKRGFDEEQIEDSKPKNKKYRHNELSWAFLSRYFSGLKGEDLNKVLNAVYWHHGISNEFGKYKDTDVIKDFSTEEISLVSDFVTNILKKYDAENFYNYSIKEKEYTPKPQPSFYVNDENASIKNAENLFIRSCIISADRLASKYDSVNDDEITNLVRNYNFVNYNFDFSKHKYFGSERFTQQLEIVDSTLKTTQINAPAGFGKTLLGMLWAFKRNKRVIWVCPTNVVATSVYNSIIEELQHFGDNNVTVELFLTSEVKKSNHKTFGFDSDIIVTNIDNYLTTTNLQLVPLNR